MKREDIAWDRLTPLQRAQLIHFYPELAEDNPKADDSKHKAKTLERIKKE